MRMDRRKKITAAMIVNEYDYDEIKQILKEYGEVREAGLMRKKLWWKEQKLRSVLQRSSAG